MLIFLLHHYSRYINYKMKTSQTILLPASRWLNSLLTSNNLNAVNNDSRRKAVVSTKKIKKRKIANRAKTRRHF
ncbi:uncharacterized protein LOC122526806 isoform X2 [Frieseomelitta varia]|uniref:uncharacterized protein LOC122526806 isoform X2 n=1 Tax=Frieseomelitta varia TaxID=561572 RepID=UPI001CB6835A|nr:uncharacterized protein LOC122526806 isoform X2 [Frieseomelitta varia]